MHLTQCPWLLIRAGFKLFFRSEYVSGESIAMFLIYPV